MSKSTSWRRAAFIFLCATTPSLASRAFAAEPPTVDQVDLSRYQGTWYEISSIPQPFQTGCTATEATYTLRSDGNVDVKNSCHLDNPKGQLTVVNGVARTLDASNAKLKVRFFGPVEGDYWIFDLGAKYDYAVVGSPDGSALWILSRTRQMDETLYENLIDGITLRGGFDPSQLVKTWQP